MQRSFSVYTPAAHLGGGFQHQHAEAEVMREQTRHHSTRGQSTSQQLIRTRGGVGRPRPEGRGRFSRSSSSHGLVRLVTRILPLGQKGFRGFPRRARACVRACARVLASFKNSPLLDLQTRQRAGAVLAFPSVRLHFRPGSTASGELATAFLEGLLAPSAGEAVRGGGWR